MQQKKTSRRVVSILFATAAMSSVWGIASQALAATNTWTGSTDGAFGTSTNWSPAPTYANFNDYVFNNATNTTIALGANRNFTSLTFQAGAGAFNFTGANQYFSYGNGTTGPSTFAVDMQSGVTNDITFSQTGTSFYGFGSAAVGGTSTGTFTNNSSTNSLNINTEIYSYNTASMIFNGSGAITLGISSKLLQNLNTMTVSNSGTGTLTLNNTTVGVYNLTGATTLSNGSTTYINGTYTTTSGISVANATTLGGSGTVAATTVAAGGIIKAGNAAGVGSLTAASMNFSGAGTVNIATAGTNFLNLTGALTTTGANSITLNVTAAPAAASTKLIGYGSLAGTGFSAFQLGVTPSSPRGFVLFNNTVAKEVDLNTDFPIWTGGVSNVWSTATLASPKNWKLNSNSAQTDYINGDYVQFDDTASGSTTIDIASANVTPGSTTFTNSSLNYILSSSGSFGIAGGGVLTKSGAGTLTINNTNSFTGAVNLNGGKINVATVGLNGANSTLGAGTTLAFNGGTLQYSGNTTTTDRLTTLGTSGGTVQVDTVGQTLTLSNTMSGTGAFTKTGAGTLSLTGTNSFAGLLTVAEGVLTTATFNGNSTNGPLGNNTTAVTIGGASTQGTLQYTGAANAAGTKGINIAAGGGKVKIVNAAAGDIYLQTSGALSGTGNLTVETSNTAGTGQAGRLIFTTVANSFSGNITLNNFTQLQSNIASGGLISGNYAAFGVGSTGTGPAITMNTSSILDIYAPSATSGTHASVLIGSLTGAGTVQLEAGFATIKVGGDNTSTTYSGVLSSAATLSLNKVGTGTLTLSGISNAYTGGTTVGGGTLLVTNASGSGAGSGNVVVNSPAILGGTGIIAMAANKLTVSGQLAPGTTGAGKLTLTGSQTVATAPDVGTSTLNLTSGSGYVVDVAGTAVGTSYDQTAVTGTIDLGTGSTLYLSLGYVPSTSDTYTIISNDGVDAIAGKFANLATNGAQGWTTYNGQAYTFAINYAAGDGNDVVLSYFGTGQNGVQLTPEPTSFALLSLGAMGLLRRRKANKQLAGV